MGAPSDAVSSPPDAGGLLLVDEDVTATHETQPGIRCQVPFKQASNRMSASCVEATYPLNEGSITVDAVSRTIMDEEDGQGGGKREPYRAKDCGS
jgi:hypothetical protein